VNNWTKLFKNKNLIQRLLIVNTIVFIFFGIFFFLFPRIDIFFSNVFFIDNEFISEKLIFIKTLRSFLKTFMIIIPLVSLFFLIICFVDKKQKINLKLSKRVKCACFGLIIGPIVGSGLIANFYFKDQWGRARPVQIEEFGGDKVYSPPFVKSDQCLKNCSWISGETSAAFSFFVGVIILKSPIFIWINLILGFLVFFCRISMGGHFLSDNIFAIIFMFYLAIIYRYLIYIWFKKRM
tara:strand:- start:100 stop:810 length:711 start_codon:yes stop_codon:yes gene_type:complete